jgi:antagonist of KipI
MMRSAIEILNPGLAASVQDTGRWGYQSSGVPVSGAVDQFAFRLANLLVGNQTTEAAIEFMILGPTIKFNGPTFIAITGGTCQAQLDNQVLQLNQAYQVKAGSVLQFKPMIAGRFGYLAIKGGILTPSVLNSRATTSRIQLGGLAGRNLQVNDRLPVEISYGLANLAHRQLTVQQPMVKKKVLHFVKGPQWQLFSARAQQIFTSAEFAVSQQADRMGYRLTGPTLPVPAKNMLSEGTVTGNVQITRSGQPIVLLADRQTAGGYPVIGTVCLADLEQLIQARNGQQFCFQAICVAAATQRLHEKYDCLQKLAAKISATRYQIPIGPQQAAGQRIAELFD